MKNTIKSILALVAGVIAVAACASCNKTFSPVAENGEVRFVVNDTKAFTETTASTLQTNGFTVAAIIDADNSTMFNSALTYSNGVFSVPGKHYYFPASGTMSFYAVYPADEVIAVSDAGAASLTYAHNSDDDLIAAKAVNVAKQSSAVQMNFDHILSQLNITAKGEETTVDYKLMKVIVTAANGGIYTFADGKWTLNGTTANLSIYDNASGMAVSTSAKTAVGSAVSVMPGTVNLRAVWKCYNKGTSIIVNEKDVTIDVTLEKGKNTTLDLSLPFNGTGLTFSSTIGAWNPDSQSAVVKYKPETIKARFTVDDNGTPDDPSDDQVVEFTKGNLFWNGEEFSCEANQYDYPTAWDANHVGHFKWGSTAADAIKSDTSTPTGNTFFAADGGVFTGFTVLSKDEWDYLLSKAVAKNSSSKNTITIDGKNCLVLKPDGFSGTVADSYSAAEWATAEAAGLVALPFAGYRYGASFYDVGSLGNYWSSTPLDSYFAWYAYFYSDDAGTYSDHRRYGFAVRLVKVVQEKPYKPELLSGTFAVNDSGKKVKFTKGNLFWNGEEFSCEANQYDYPTTWDANHVGHFKWASTAADAIKSDTSMPTGDTFFAANGGVFEGFTVLSSTEWQYLIDHSVEGGSFARMVAVNGKNCVILKPDGFIGTVKNSYTAETWATAEASGLVALPFAGHRYGTSFNWVGSYGEYWSLEAYDDEYKLYAQFADSMDDDTAIKSNYAEVGYSVRLVSVQ